jgi:DNA-binding NarL/FixJ family response regulator
MKTIRVLLVDDHAIVRAGIRALLEAAGGLHVIGEAENGQQAVLEAERLRPDVVLLDLAMPRLNGAEAARQIAREVPTARVLILSSYSDAQHLRQAIEAGAAGYLMKESAGAELVEAVREAVNGGAFFSPALLKQLKEWLVGPAEGRAATAWAATLSRREAEVLQLIAEGYASKQIAALLSLSKKTVEKHRQSLMGKAGCHNIATLTIYAVAHGVVELNNTPHHTPNWSAMGLALGRCSSQQAGGPRCRQFNVKK